MNLIPLPQWAAQQIPKINRQRAHVLATQGRIKGAVMIGNRWFCPKDAQRLPPKGVKK